MAGTHKGAMTTEDFLERVGLPMYILMDMEWITIGTRVCPTQISALKVDKYYHQIGRVDLLIRPFNADAERWNNMAYNGYPPQLFLSAPSAPSAFNRISSWIADDDTMIWWIRDQAVSFSMLHGSLLKEKPRYAITYISPVVQKAFRSGGLKEKLSLYGAAARLNIQAVGPEHCSKSDVDIIHAILSSLAIDLESAHQLDARAADRPIWQITKPVPKRIVPHAFYYDGKLLHLGTCPQVTDDCKLYGTLKECIKQKLKPCECLKAEYIKEWKNLNWIVIRNCNFRFVYKQSGDVFHRPDCPLAMRLRYSVLRGAAKYQTCLDHGKRPCKVCNPSPDDEQYDYVTGEKRVKQKKRVPAPAQWQTRHLTNPEKVALRRQEVAAKERAALPANLEGQADWDQHTLTRSDYAFFAAVGYKNFHLPNCQKIASLSHLRGFARFEDAVKAGLTPCRLCKPSAKFDLIASVPIYQQKRTEEKPEDLDGLCEQYGWEHCLENGEYRIETPVGKWKLLVGTKPVDVYHINLVNRRGPGYHKQHRLFLSLTDTVEYIRRHDEALMEKKD